MISIKGKKNYFGLFFIFIIRTEPLNSNNINMFEKQEIKHIDMINQIKLDYTEQIENLHETISQMSQTMHNYTQNDFKYKALFEAILDKDIRIQELDEEKRRTRE